jgi:hypothetical protein
MKARLFSAVMIVGFLIERFLYTYEFSYFAAVIALVALAVRPSYRDFLTLSALFLIALGSDLAIIRIEIRYIAFFILFLAAARFWFFDPRLLFAIQALFLLVSSTNPEVAVERYVFGTAVSAMLLIVFLKDQPRQLSRKILDKSLFIVSLLLPILGYGSRAALAVWLVLNWRVTAIFLPVAAISLSLFINNFIIDIPVIDKALSSFDELFAISPIDGPVSLRAIENVFFADWINTASIWQITMGSGYEASLPGNIIGNQFEDFTYIPHAFLLGVSFQLGLLGLLVLLWRLYHLLRISGYGTEMTMLALVILILGFVAKHGFFDTDLLMVFASLNYIADYRNRAPTARQLSYARP